MTESLEGFYVAEEAVRDAVALLTVEISGGPTEGRQEARRILGARGRETPERRMVRIVSTIDLVGTLAAQAFDLAAKMRNLLDEATVEEPGEPKTGAGLLQGYAGTLARNEVRRFAVFLREYDQNYRPPGMRNWYCPACCCSKSGHRAAVNYRGEACSDHDCACHDEDLYTEETR